MSSIIYRVTNIITGKSYVGQTRQTLEKRWKQHLTDSKRKRFNYYFYNAIRKYGPHSWTKEIVEEIFDIELLNERERYWISFFNTMNDGYNMTSGGEQGKIFSDASRQKLSLSKMGCIPWNKGLRYKSINQSLSKLGRK